MSSSSTKKFLKTFFLSFEEDSLFIEVHTSVVTIWAFSRASSFDDANVMKSLALSNNG